jgi:hypothetical protein
MVHFIYEAQAMMKRRQKADPDLKRKHFRLVALLEPKGLLEDFHRYMDAPGVTYQSGRKWVLEQTGEDIGGTSVYRYLLDRKQKIRRMQERNAEADALMKELRTKSSDEMAQIRDTLIFNQFLTIQDELKDAPIDKLALRMVQGQNVAIKREALELERQKVDLAKQMLEFRKATAQKAKEAIAGIPDEKLAAANPEELRKVVDEAIAKRLGLEA